MQSDIFRTGVSGVDAAAHTFNFLLVQRAVMLILPSVLLQPGLLATPLGKIFLALLGIAVVVLVAKFLLSVAWRVVSIAAVLVGVALLLVTFGLF